MLLMMTMTPTGRSTPSWRRPDEEPAALECTSSTIQRPSTPPSCTSTVHSNSRERPHRCCHRIFRNICVLSVHISRNSRSAQRTSYMRTKLSATGRKMSPKIPFRPKRRGPQPSRWFRIGSPESIYHIAAQSVQPLSQGVTL